MQANETSIFPLKILPVLNIVTLIHGKWVTYCYMKVTSSFTNSKPENNFLVRK